MVKGVFEMYPRPLDLGVGVQGSVSVSGSVSFGVGLLSIAWRVTVRVITTGGEVDVAKEWELNAPKICRQRAMTARQIAVGKA